MNMRMPIVIIVSSLILISSSAMSQENENRSSTNIFIGEVQKIDTIHLNKEEYNSTGTMSDISKALKVTIRIDRKIYGSFNKVNNFIIIELTPADHWCSYDFKVGDTYTIHANKINYSSKSIKKIYRKKFFSLDCFKMPIPIEQ